MPVNITGAIFDLDGTLLDSGLTWENVALDYLKKHHVTPTRDFLETYHSMTIMESSEYFCREYGIGGTREEIAAEINRMIELFYFHEVQLRSGAAELLSVLSQRGVSMCIATMTDRYLVEAALKRCGAAHYFSAVLTCTEVGAGKREPTIYERALEVLHTPRESTYVFEDALYALRTAKGAGFRTAGIRSVTEPNQDEMRRTADYYLEEMDDFLSIL